MSTIAPRPPFVPSRAKSNPELAGPDLLPGDSAGFFSFVDPVVWPHQVLGGHRNAEKEKRFLGIASLTINYLRRKIATHGRRDDGTQENRT